jgi:hypothetical protein
MRRITKVGLVLGALCLSAGGSKAAASPTENAVSAKTGRSATKAECRSYYRARQVGSIVICDGGFGFNCLICTT